jgi:signal peptidase II
MQAERGTSIKESTPRSRNLSVFLALTIAFAAIDLGTKSLAFHYVPDDSRVAVVPGALYLQVAQNTGGLFGMAKGRIPVFVVLSILTMALVGWMFHAFGRKSLATAIGLALIMGGAVGNLFDRIRFSYVRDFILVQIGRFQWPNFNVADAWICIGAALLVYYAWRHPTQEATSSKRAAVGAKR